MVNVLLFTRSSRLFIWSYRLFIRSTFYFLYGQRLLFIWSTRVFIWSTFYFLYGQVDFLYGQVDLLHDKVDFSYGQLFTFYMGRCKTLTADYRAEVKC